MAKRKRLSPAGAFGDPPPGPAPGPASTPAPETKSAFRRGPPIAEVAGGAASAAALEEMTETWQAAREGGRLVVELPLEQIELEHLTRDRLSEDPEDAETLRESLRHRGQQTPVEVVALPGGASYGLLSGWRRCRALRALHEETGDPRFATVLALLRQPRDAPDAYLAMIEENEIRANLSHYERARIVVQATDQGIFPSDKKALSTLFASVPRARRSKIGSFIGIVRALDGELRFPEALNERVGLELAQALRIRPELAGQLRTAMAAADPANPTDEREAIEAALQAREAPEKESLTPVSETDAPPQPDDPVRPDAPAQPEAPLVQHPGLTLRRDGRGRLVLEGAQVDEALAADLAAWLAARAGS